MKVFGRHKTNNNSSSSNAMDAKFFNDPVHGSIWIPSLCVAICDTPQFQRLRHIKQLGLACFVYPGATHTRFDHCLGVCHLAGEFAKRLREKQPSFAIDDRDILCVQVAGLCHDLGHGPFSHFWEHFVKKVRPHAAFSHEKCSIDMLDVLIEKNGLMKQFEVYFGADYKSYLTYIKEQINGDSESRLRNPWMVNGVDKSFLYEIVANKMTGVDVDKFDYLARDSYNMGVLIGFDHRHVMEFARICFTDQQVPHICFRDKERYQLAEMFRARRYLHKVGFQHRVVMALDQMLLDMLVIADSRLLVPAHADAQRRWRLSEAHQDLKSFSLINDQILYAIQWSDDDSLEEAKNIWKRIEHRNFYMFVGKAHIDEWLTTEIKNNPVQYCSEVLDLVKESRRQCLSCDDIFLKMQIFNNGSDVVNPLDRLYFYSKRDHSVGRRLSDQRLVSYLQLNSGPEMFVLCFTKKPKLKAEVHEAFCKWCHNHNLIMVDHGEPTDSE